MGDTAIRVTGGAGTGTAGLPGRHADVERVPVTAPGADFTDVAGHASQEAVRALAARGILSGRGDDRFDPDATMTRAEFAAAVVGALGLTPKAAEVFADVPAGQWYAPYVGTAQAYGLVSGTGNGQFSPQGTITRQEAAVMVCAAAGLCGLDTGMEDPAVLNVLAQFPDYVSIAPWARPGTAFCYRSGILDQSDLNVEPARAVLRGEIAQMLYNLLDAAGLL